MLILQTGSILSDINGRVVVTFFNPDEERAETGGVGSEPDRLCFRTDGIAGLVGEELFTIAVDVVGILGGVEVFDVVTGVMVHPIKIIRSLH